LSISLRIKNVTLPFVGDFILEPALNSVESKDIEARVFYLHTHKRKRFLLLCSFEFFFITFKQILKKFVENIFCDIVFIFIGDAWEFGLFFFD
jgi:hypothetical protein